MLTDDTITFAMGPIRNLQTKKYLYWYQHKVKNDGISQLLSLRGFTCESFTLPTALDPKICCLCFYLKLLVCKLWPSWNINPLQMLKNQGRGRGGGDFNFKSQITIVTDVLGTDFLQMPWPRQKEWKYLVHKLNFQKSKRLTCTLWTRHVWNMIPEDFFTLKISKTYTC